MTQPAPLPANDPAPTKAPEISVAFVSYVKAPGMSDTTRLLRVTTDKNVDRHIRVDRLEADSIGILAYRDGISKRYPWHTVLETLNVPEFNLTDAFEKLADALLKGKNK